MYSEKNVSEREVPQSGRTPSGRNFKSFMSFMHSESARAYPIGRRSEGLDDVGPTLSLCAFPVALYAAVGLAVVGDVEFCCPKSPKKCSKNEKW